MIFEIIMYGIIVLSDFFGRFLPGYGEVPLKLPWGVDDYVALGINGYKVLAQSFPPMQTILNAFLIYIGFRIAIQLLKAVPILGRTLQ